MKIRHILILLLVFVTATSLYVSVVEPLIDKPVVLSGFFALLFCDTFLLVLLCTNRFNIGRARYLASGLVSLAVVYVVALSTLNTLSLLDIAVVVSSLLIISSFIGGPLKKNRSRN